MRLLSDRPHFRRQLSQKLLDRGYDAEEVEATLERLQELSYLDEDQAVRMFVEQKRRRVGWGISRLRAELGRRGADSGSVSKVLRGLNEEDDELLARREVERFLARGGGDPDRLARRLARKGIPTRVIVRLLNGVRER